VQYAAHTLMSGMLAAGALRDTFSGTPPDEDGGDSGVDDDNDDTYPCPGVPDYWQVFIQEAQNLGILDEDAAARWGREFERQALQDAEDAAEREAAYLKSQFDGDDDDLLG
ncbi:hypothetical protein SBRCBS47491_004612, partial [Sporothrix bragantina]